MNEVAVTQGQTIEGNANVFSTRAKKGPYVAITAATIVEEIVKR